MTTALGENEVLTSIGVPASKAGQGMAYSKFFHPASRYAVVGAAAIISIDGGTCSSASIAVGGLVPSPARASSVEAALIGKSLTEDTISEAAGRVADDLGDSIIGDIYASEGYRQAMAPVYVGRAVSAAVERAG